jgi:hypothetical protein
VIWSSGSLDSCMCKNVRAVAHVRSSTGPWKDVTMVGPHGTGLTAGRAHGHGTCAWVIGIESGRVLSQLWHHARSECVLLAHAPVQSYASNSHTEHYCVVEFQSQFARVSDKSS